MTHYECASAGARRIEKLTDAQEKHIRSLVELGQFENAKNSSKLTVAECVYGFQYEHRLKLGKVQRSTAPQRSVEPAPAVTAPVIAPAISVDEQTETHRHALAMRIASLK